MAFSPDGKILAVGYYGAGTHLWDTTTGKIIRSLTAPGARHVVDAVAFSPDGKTLAVGEAYFSGDIKGTGGTYLWDTATGKIIDTLTDPGIVAVGAVAFSPDGKTLAASGFNSSIYLWNMNWLGS